MYVVHFVVGMCGIDFLFWFSFGSVFFKKTWIRFGMSLIRFGSKMRFGSYIIVIILLLM